MKLNATLPVLLLSVPAFAAAAEDPWSRVPALPTACYSESDHFSDQALAASEALNEEKNRQQVINDALAQQLAEVDPMDQQQRMMTFLMENPEQAQKYMESLQMGGQQIQELVPEMADRDRQLTLQLDELSARYKAEQEQLAASHAKKLEAYYAQAEKGCTEATIARANALVREENAAYEQLCAAWWVQGPFHDWFAEFRQFKHESAAEWDLQADSQALNYRVMGIDADAYRPTQGLEAPVEYLRRAALVFSKRRVAPNRQTVTECGSGHG